MKQNRKVRLGKALLLFIPASVVLGTSCVGDIRQALVAAGLDFVEGTAGLFLEAAIPVEDFINPQ